MATGKDIQVGLEDYVDMLGSILYSFREEPGEVGSGISYKGVLAEIDRSLNNVADGLFAIADAIREKS